MKIDKTTFKADNDNYYQTNKAKTQIVIAFSFRKGNNHILRMKNKEYGKSKEWNTYTISRDGSVYQHFDPKNHTDFLGKKEFDHKIISIVLENMGFLYFENGIYTNWLNEECEPENVGFKKFEIFNNWEKFTEEQINSLVLLCDELCVEFSIPKEFIGFDCYVKEIPKLKGIAFKSNYFEVGFINPLFNMDEFSNLINKK